MKYIVVATTIADEQLARIWLMAPDRQSVSNASDHIGSLLRHDAHLVGRLHPSGWRVVAEPPIVVSFTVNESDRMVKILSGSYRP